MAILLVSCLFASGGLNSAASKPSGLEADPHLETTERGERADSNSTVQPANPVWLLYRELSRCRRSLPENVRWRIAGAIHDQSRRYGYDPLFVVAMAMVESGCSPSARGPRGALGLIQVKPETARAVARESGMMWSGGAMLTRPSVNLRIGLHYLATLERHLNDPYLALAAYNMGPARVSEMGRYQARQTRYVRRVVDHYEELLKRNIPAGSSAAR